VLSQASYRSTYVPRQTMKSAERAEALSANIKQVLIVIAVATN
jgi:hypothetical protein